MVENGAEMEPRATKWTKSEAKRSKKSKWIAQDGPRQRQTSPKKEPAKRPNPGYPVQL